jgi:hypothetical protein
LLSFYFGSLSDDDRLKIERRMLTDPEVLLDYLDLKREVEGAVEIPKVPSPAVWHRLKSKVVVSRRARLSLALGVGLAAAVVSILFVMSRPRQNSPRSHETILFDSGSEQFGHSNVL